MQRGGETREEGLFSSYWGTRLVVVKYFLCWIKRVFLYFFNIFTFYGKYIYIFIYIYICTYIHTFIHSYIHTYMTLYIIHTYIVHT